jgi:iron transport multicopper oxidase
MNGTTYLPQIVPTLYTALSAPAQYVTDLAIYGPTSNTVIFNNPLGIAEIVVNNFDAAAHPFHIHGHIAQIVAQGPPGKPGNQSVFTGNYTQMPTRRDVFMVNANSYTIIRFKTGNPGKPTKFKIWINLSVANGSQESGFFIAILSGTLKLG